MAKARTDEDSTQLRDDVQANPQVGDRVEIKYFGGKYGKVTELRGPLGPGGAEVYRVLVQRKPTAAYVELLGDQIKVLPRR